MTAIFALLLAFGIGVATAAQSPTNGSLGSLVGPIQASLVSFSGGLLILSVLCVFIGTGDITKVTTVPAWMLTGGLYGAYIVFVMSVCTHNLGVALSLTLIMLGQLVGGMVIDTWGLMGSEVVEVSPLRIGGSALVLTGIILVYLSRLRDQKTLDEIELQRQQPRRTPEKKSPANVLFLQTILVFSAGVVSAVQAPVNAGLSAVTGTLESGVVSFASGWVVLLVASLIVGKGRLNSLKGVRAWQLTGGIYGAYGVPALIVATPILGVSLTMGGSMVGQLIGGIAIDSLGLFRVKRRRVDRLRMVGAIVLFAGVMLVSLGTH